VTHLRKMMLEELQRRHYSEATTQRYIPPHSYQIETAYRINNRGQYSAPQSVSEACTGSSGFSVEGSDAATSPRFLLCTWRESHFQGLGRDQAFTLGRGGRGSR
jgi:hypothetical protein